MRRRHLFELDDDLAEDPLALNRRGIILASAALLLLGLMMLGSGALLIASGLDPVVGWLLVGVAIVRFLAIPLSWRGHEHGAFLGNIAMGMVLYAALSLEFGPGAGIGLWAAPLATLPQLAAVGESRRVRGAMFALALVVVFGTAVATGWLPPRVPLAPGTQLLFWRVNLAAVMVFSATVVIVYRRLLDRAEGRLQAAQRVSDRLLANILPGAIAQRLKRDEYPIADHCPEATVLFADIVGFTAYAAARPPEAVVELLNRVFYAFDDMVERRGLEKIKTIGDAYMVASGVPHGRADHAEAVADLAFEMLDFVAGLAGAGGAIELRIGIHSGPVVAGVIGKHKFSYDIWGDTVNTAARLQASSEPGRIQISEETARRLGRGWRLERRGTIELKGLGEVATYFLLGRDGLQRSGVLSLGA